MKKMLTFTLTLIAINSTLSAKQNHIELGAGYINAKDNLTYIHNKSIINLTDSPVGLDLYVPVFSLYYNGFFIGVGENIEGVGYRHDFGDFSVEAAINSYEVFEDPYRISERVDAFEAGVFLSTTMYEMMELSLGYKNIEVDDKVSKLDTKQSANEINFDVNAILLSLGQNSYAGLGYLFTYYDAKGKSNSYQKNGISIFAIFQFSQDYELVSEILYADYEFDKKNSYFGKIRDEKEFSAVVNLKIDNIFKSSDFYLQTGVFYTGVDSNIDFFDKEYVGSSLSIGYRF